MALTKKTPIGHFYLVANRDLQYLKAFGQNLKRIRLSAGLSQEDLAHKADSVLSQIGRIERGERAPNILTVKKIAEALDIKEGDLFDFKSED